MKNEKCASLWYEKNDGKHKIDFQVPYDNVWDEWGLI